MFRSSYDYLADASLAAQYVASRASDAAEFLSEVQWRPGNIPGLLNANIYGVSVVRDVTRNLLHCFPCWGEALHQGEVEVFTTEEQFIAWFISRFW